MNDTQFNIFIIINAFNNNINDVNQHNFSALNSNINNTIRNNLFRNLQKHTFSTIN